MWTEGHKSRRRTKSTRKRNTPENADNRRFRESAFSGVCSLFSSKGVPTHPKTQLPKSQILGAMDYPQFRVCCVFGCVFCACQKSCIFSTPAPTTTTSPFPRRGSSPNMQRHTYSGILFLATALSREQGKNRSAPVLSDTL